LVEATTLDVGGGGRWPGGDEGVLGGGGVAGRVVRQYVLGAPFFNRFWRCPLMCESPTRCMPRRGGWDARRSR
jgi:hypothetical protein